MKTAIIKSSGRTVPILINGLRFYVYHGRGGSMSSVSGPFWVTDRRFKLQ